MTQKSQEIWDKLSPLGRCIITRIAEINKRNKHDEDFYFGAGGDIMDFIWDIIQCEGLGYHYLDFVELIEEKQKEI